VQDKLVSARGHTTYVQAVLVPELAVQLIMEDMSVNQEEARAVLMDSVWGVSSSMKRLLMWL